MNIAVVGASNHPEKYGNIIMNHLLSHGHTVFPVNPKEETIAGIPCFRKVSDIPRKVDIVDIVVPPEVTIKVLRHVRSLGRMDVWIQPGAESSEVIKYLERHSKDFGKITYGQCIMVSLERAYPTAA